MVGQISQPGRLDRDSQNELLIRWRESRDEVACADLVRSLVPVARGAIKATLAQYPDVRANVDEVMEDIGVFIIIEDCLRKYCLSTAMISTYVFEAISNKTINWISRCFYRGKKWFLWMLVVLKEVILVIGSILIRMEHGMEKWLGFWMILRLKLLGQA